MVFRGVSALFPVFGCCSSGGAFRGRCVSWAAASPGPALLLLGDAAGAASGSPGWILL